MKGIDEIGDTMGGSPKKINFNPGLNSKFVPVLEIERGDKILYGEEDLI